MPLDRAREAHQRGQLAEAEALYRAALQSNPRQPDVACELAAVLEDAKRIDDAIAVLREALAHSPDHARSHHYLGILHAKLRHHDPAIAHLQRAVALKPDYSQAWNNLGNALRDTNRLDESIRAFEAALRLRPDYAIAYFNLSNLLRMRGRNPEAEAALRKLLALQPNHRAGLLALGSVLRQLDRFDESAETYRRAVALDPGSTEARVRLWMVEQAMCDWSNFEPFVQALRQRLHEPRPYQVAPFTYLHLPSSSAEQATAARLWVADRAALMPVATIERVRPRDGPLRIGYLSSDFRTHPLVALIGELLERHDRSRVSVYAYAYGPDDVSAGRRRIVDAVDHWRDLSGDTDPRAAQRIRDDRIDVLIDLNGYTRFAREEIPVLRPAPVQAGWLGYLGPLSAPWYDYTITDRFVSPPEQQANFAERFLYLPHCYCPSDTRRAVAMLPPSRRDCGLPEEGFVFCCFNNNYKIVPAVFDVWMRLLRDVPGSVLWLVSNQRSTAANLRREAQRRGIAPERLVFAGYAPMGEYLARLTLADLFLDTHPYNAGATANDALLAGVPLLTCSGETYASRVAGSQLHAIGLPELVTSSLADYEATALALARGRERLASLRERLARNRHTHPLFDMGAFTGNFEAALESAYDETMRRRSSEG